MDKEKWILHSMSRDVHSRGRSENWQAVNKSDSKSRENGLPIDKVRLIN